jgi:tetratricopeptide (TPR) repeat protein
MSHNNLGALLAGWGQGAAAEAAYRAALAIREKLAADFPAAPDYRRDLAQSHHNLGLLLAGRGQGAAAEAVYRAALAIQEKLAADFPAVPDYAVDLGNSYSNLGTLVRPTDAAAALGWHAKAIDRLAPVVAADPKSVTARQFLRNSHAGRARDLAALRRHAEALPDWDRALELDDGTDRAELRLGRAACLARSGRVADAVQEAAASVAEPQTAADTLYDCARVFAVASSAGNNPEADAHSARAVALLRQAFGKGYTNVAHMVRDSDLDPLRRRADYADMLWDLAYLPTPAK